MCVDAIDPYGQLLAPISSTPAVSEYKYAGKEWSDVTLSYDFGARNYLPSIPRWSTMDPLAEKYYSISPYVYCAGNPVNLLDEEGRDSYSVNKKGDIVKIDDEGGEKVDYLYGMDENGNGNIDKKNRVTITDTSIIKNLLDKNDKGVYSSSSKNKMAIMAAFKFFADNTTVEWAVHKSDSGEYSLGTIKSPNNAGSYIDYGIDGMVVASVHSHPGEYKNQQKAISSMGYGLGSGLSWGDYGNVITDIRINGRITRHNYVYFPSSHSLFYVSRNQPIYINKMMSSKSFFVGALR